MKRLIVMILVLSPFFSSCNKDNDNDLNFQIREIAWSSLCAYDKSTVIVDWKKAPVTETIYKAKSAYAVRFNTSDDALLGPIIVYLDKTSLVELGQGLRM